MQYNTLLLVTAFTSGISFFLVYRVAVLDENFKRLKRDLDLVSFSGKPKPAFSKPEELNNGILAGIVARGQQTRASVRRTKREEVQQGCRSQSFMQLSANAAKQPFVRGNVTVIPWTVAVQQGAAISSEGNKILIQQNGFYMVYGQEPFWATLYVAAASGSQASQRSFDLLRCLQEMPQTNSANTCYTAGLVKLDQRDELELVIPDRPQAQISMDADSTFFGIMQLI